MKGKFLHITAMAAIAIGVFSLIGSLTQQKQDYTDYFTGYDDRISFIVEGYQMHWDGFIDNTKPQKEMLCGGYTEQRELSGEDLVLFSKALGEVPFTPLSVATQVVAGLNYRFWCRYDDGSENAPSHCFVTIYQPLRGNPIISKVQDENGGPEMKVIFDSEGNVGRYIGENETSYQGETQDYYWIEKDRARTEIMKACEGQGILTLKDTGRKPVFSRPDTQSDTVGTMIHEEGYVPEVYRCLGYIKGWFLTDVDGKAGFIREEFVNWDPINTF